MASVEWLEFLDLLDPLVTKDPPDHLALLDLVDLLAPTACLVRMV